MPRVLILCTHNSARSQMAEGLTRRAARDLGLDLDVFSAGTEATIVKPDAITVMAELGIDLGTHTSKTLFDVPDPWNFEYVVTVCGSAAEACPAYPAKTRSPSSSSPENPAAARSCSPRGPASVAPAQVMPAKVMPAKVMPAKPASVPAAGLVPPGLIPNVSASAR